jgi:hypothetical protein
MASTIKLKTSTSSGNVPASLSTGEVAINVADGVWYYGGASAVQQNFKFGSVTVTGNTSLDGKLVVTGNTVMNGTLSASSVNVGNGTGSVSAATITASGEIDGGSLDIEGDADINGTTNLDDVDVDGDITMANNKQLFLGSANASDPAITFLNDPTTGMRLPLSGSMRFVVEGTDIISFNQTTFFPVADSSVTLGLTGYRWSTVYTDAVTVTDDITVGGDISVDGTTNLDNTDIDGTLVVDGSNISLDSTSTLNIDNSNTSNGITIGTATSGVPIQLGHSTSNVRINDNLVVTGNTVMNGTLSATTSLKVGNGNGTISAATITGTIGSDAAPVAAYISSGEIDGVVLGGENKVQIASAGYIDIAGDTADNVSLLVVGNASQSANILEVNDGGEEGTTYFSVAANGRSTINSAYINGGSINAASIGASTRNTGAFTTLIGQLGITSQSTLVVTGNTTLNGTLSATTSCKVGNGDGLISGATLHAGNVLKSDGTLVVTGNTVLNGTLSASSINVGNGNGSVSAATYTAAGSISLPDNGAIIMGDGDDTEIKQTGSETIIKDASTGNIKLRAGTVTVQNGAANKTMAVFNGANKVELFYNNNSKFETTNTGVDVTGDVLASGALVVTGNTVLNGTLSATTSLKVGNGDGLISAATFTGTKHLLRSGGIYINDDPFVQNSLYMGNSSGNQPFNWNDPQAAGGVLSDTGTVNISEDDMKWASILPFDISKIEVQCSLRTGGASTGDDFFIGIYTASRADCAGASTMDITKIADSQDTFCQGKYVTNDFDYIGNLDKGTLIFIGIGTESSTAAKNGAGILNVTITQR